MSTFKVTSEIIATSTPHPNADRLDISTLEGMTFQFVTGRDQFKPGDQVVYYPIDSILPAPIIHRMGLTGKLAGKDKSRVKTLKLRGVTSQGLVEPLNDPNGAVPAGTDMTELLGVLKWEPEPIPCQAGTLLPLSSVGVGLSKYDIEGADRYPDVVELLMDQQVCVTEKLEGMNFSVTVIRGGGRFVNQRDYTIIPDMGSLHDFWKVAESQQLFQKAEEFMRFGGNFVTLYGEYIGPKVQKNIYKLQANEVCIFDVKLDSGWLSSNQLDALSASGKDPILPWGGVVPILSHGPTLRQWLNGRTVQEAANGESRLTEGVLREGIVIRPMAEQHHPELGRLILKQRSGEYLAMHDL